LVDTLIKRGDEVIIIDNLSSSITEVYNNFLKCKNITFYKADIRNFNEIMKISEDIDEIFHLAADPRVGLSAEIPIENFEINVKGTLNVLEAARKKDIKKIFFTSSGGTIYGESEIIPTPETASLKPISCYGASKACCEMYSLAYASSFGLDIVSFRLANIYGPRSNHGVIFDFYKKLKTNPKKLVILGDGKQKKSYLYVKDCIEAMILIEKQNLKGFNAFNIGSEDWITVREIADIVVSLLGLSNVKYEFTGGKQGWIGDVTKMRLNISKIKKLGWRQKISIEEGIKYYIEYLKKAKL
ncbi:MAG: GDP-mannose 4,6-dehydratase, partial [Candidatus Odinarchaeia archaeon]